MNNEVSPVELKDYLQNAFCEMKPYNMFLAIPQNCRVHGKLAMYLEMYFGPENLITRPGGSPHKRMITNTPDGLVSVFNFFPSIRVDNETDQTGVLIHISSFTDPAIQYHQFLFLPTEEISLIDTNNRSQTVSPEGIEILQRQSSDFRIVEIESVLNGEISTF